MDLNFIRNYSGFRYFLLGKIDKPSKPFMERLADKLDYEMVTIPIKKTDENKLLIEKFKEDFFSSLEEHVSAYENDTSKVYLKDYGKTSSIDDAISEVDISENLFGDEKIDIEDLF